MKKSIIIISSLLMITLATGSAFAWGPKGKRGQGFNQNCPVNNGQNVLDSLSQEQRDELKALRQKFIDDTYKFKVEKSQKRYEMRLLMETSDPARAELIKLSEKISDLDQEIQAKRIDFQLAAKKIAPELGIGPGFGMGRGMGDGFKKHHNRYGRGSGQGQNRYNCDRFMN